MADSTPPTSVVDALLELVERGRGTSPAACGLLYDTLRQAAVRALGGVHDGARLEPHDLAADVLIKLMDRADLGLLTVSARSEPQARAYLRRCVYFRGLDVLGQLRRELPEDLDGYDEQLIAWFDEERSDASDSAAVEAFFEDINRAFRAFLGTVRRRGGATNVKKAYRQLLLVCRGGAELADYRGEWSSRGVMDRHMSNARRAVQRGIDLLENAQKFDTERADQLRQGFRLLYVHGRRGRAAVRQNS